MNLSGKVAVVTGAGSSIGRELARQFARLGARVVCCGRRLDALGETVRQIRAEGFTALPIAVDVTNRQQVDAMVLQVMDQFGQIDLLFNNAGSFGALGPVWDVDPELWLQDVTTNLYGSMLCARAVLPGMMARNSGVILNMDGGGGAHGPNVGGSGYGSSKAALLRFSEGLGRELEIAGSAVLVMGINPGFVHTAMTQNIADSPAGQRWQPFVKDWIAQGRVRAPEDCAKAAVKLLSIADASLNGCTFSVDTDFEAVERLKPRIRAEGRFVLRMRTEKDQER
jgi:NAD(P)-dependent dehydrogenase (short-subunit alcohol dehydrogenase family)